MKKQYQCKHCIWYNSAYLQCNNEKLYKKQQIRYILPDQDICRYFKEDIYSILKDKGVID